MRRLEEAGISDVDALRACSLDDLVKIGVRKELASQIQAFLRRR
jgi:Trk K+ transport system NAD-binding subunit